LSASEPLNSFDIERIIVSYTGPVLAPVGQRDLFNASLFRQKQIDHHLDRGNNNRGLAFLQEHLDDNPQDIEAHLLLADTLKRRSDLNGSIAEYRRALALAQGSNDLMMQKKAIKGLRQFGLVPDATVSTMSVSQSANPVR
jgi:tetratricopeptide (TPR) repeat protein